MPPGKPEQAEQIIPKLREVEVELGRGKTVAKAVKKIGVTEQTYYRWKKDLLQLEEEVRGPADRPGEAAEGAREGELPAEASAGGCRVG